MVREWREIATGKITEWRYNVKNKIPDYEKEGMSISQCDKILKSMIGDTLFKEIKSNGRVPMDHLISHYDCGATDHKNLDKVWVVKIPCEGEEGIPTSTQSIPQLREIENRGGEGLTPTVDNSEKEEERKRNLVKRGSVPVSLTRGRGRGLTTLNRGRGIRGRGQLISATRPGESSVRPAPMDVSPTAHPWDEGEDME